MITSSKLCWVGAQWEHSECGPSLSPQGTNGIAAPAQYISRRSNPHVSSYKTYISIIFFGTASHCMVIGCKAITFSQYFSFASSSFTSAQKCTCVSQWGLETVSSPWFSRCGPCFYSVASGAQCLLPPCCDWELGCMAAADSGPAVPLISYAQLINEVFTDVLASTDFLWPSRGCLLRVQLVLAPAPPVTSSDI